jgi:hypothetical protein
MIVTVVPVAAAMIVLSRPGLVHASLFVARTNLPALFAAVAVMVIFATA